MQCANCNSSAVSDLGLCQSCDESFRHDAAEAARSLEADEPGAKVRATKLVARQVELAARAVLEPLREPMQRWIARTEQPKPQPVAIGVLGDLTKGENQ